ncbi:Antibiotic biosynthesis monooxygenase [Marinomonas aquimarina]|uniref:Antibiotic biosynthesis monooxygenase n=1 Tax=Marinomonas aquimarina TaxID=295068 RepID=A0A1A8T796_9GAMM|nr:antibiotic biosynthesis monooxygenase [Marinomonas aquimarina]SBS27248.1 Antibiotic biosynthesis monooxygenase [Marinomonas aquimarina]
MSKIILQGYILVPAAELETVQSELRTHIQLTLAEQGCLAFSVTQSAVNPLRFDVYEEFVDQSAFDAHQQRVGNSNWGAVTVNVERHYQISQT